MSDEWMGAMTPHEAEQWSDLRERAEALDAERRKVTDGTNRLRQRVMQRALYRRRNNTAGRAA
jgi:hypothetical protein